MANFVNYVPFKRELLALADPTISEELLDLCDEIANIKQPPLGGDYRDKSVDGMFDKITIDKGEIDLLLLDDEYLNLRKEMLRLMPQLEGKNSLEVLAYFKSNISEKMHAKLKKEFDEKSEYCGITIGYFRKFEETAVLLSPLDPEYVSNGLIGLSLKKENFDYQQHILGLVDFCGLEISNDNLKNIMCHNTIGVQKEVCRTWDMTASDLQVAESFVSILVNDSKYRDILPHRFVLKKLMEIYTNPDVSDVTKTGVYKVLREMGSTDIERLIVFGATKNGEMSTSIIEAVRKLVRNDDAISIEAVLSLFATPNPELRQFVLNEVKKIKNRELIRSWAKSKVVKPDIRLAAIEALGQFGKAEEISLLLDIVQDPKTSESELVAAIISLGSLKVQDAFEVLVNTLSKPDTNPKLRLVILDVLGDVGSVRAVATLETYSMDKNVPKEMRISALKSIGKIGYLFAVKNIIKVILEMGGDDEITLAAIDVLGLIGGDEATDFLKGFLARQGLLIEFRNRVLIALAQTDNPNDLLIIAELDIDQGTLPANELIADKLVLAKELDTATCVYQKILMSGVASEEAQIRVIGKLTKIDNEVSFEALMDILQHKVLPKKVFEELKSAARYVGKTRSPILIQEYLNQVGLVDEIALVLIGALEDNCSDRILKLISENPAYSDSIRGKAKDAAARVSNNRKREMTQTY